MRPESKQVLRAWRAQQRKTRYADCQHSVRVNLAYWNEVGSSDLAAWLESRGKQNHDFLFDFDPLTNALNVRFADADTAMLFKLTYGGV